MTWIDKFYDKKVKDFELMVTQDKNFYRMYAKDNKTDEVIFLKNFVTKDDYCRFLVEAVVMRLGAKKEQVSKVRKMWKDMLYFLRDTSRKISTFLFVLFFSFGVCGCSHIQGEVVHSKSEVTTIKGETYSCEYNKGLFINCKKEIKNEN